MLAAYLAWFGFLCECDCDRAEYRAVFVRRCGHKFWSSATVASLVLALLAVKDDASKEHIRRIMKPVKDHLPSCLSADHVALIVKLLENVNEGVRCWTLDLLSEVTELAGIRGKVLELLGDESQQVQAKALNLLTSMPDGQIPELSTQDGHCLLRYLATSSPEVQQQVLHLLDRKMLTEQVMAVFALSDCHLHKQALYFLEETKPKKWFAELSIEHRERLCSLLASTDCLVQQRAMTLLETRMANELSFVLGAEDWKKLRALLASPDWKVQQQTLDLLARPVSHELTSELSVDLWWCCLRLLLSNGREEVQQSAARLLEKKMPNELLVKDFGNFHGVLRHADSRISDVSRRLFEKKTSRDVLALYLEKIVPVLLTDSELQPWSFGFLIDRIPTGNSRQFAALLNKHLLNFEHNLRNFLQKRSVVEHNLTELFRQLPVSCLLLAMPRDRIASWRDDEGNTWLHLAAEAGHLEACEALVDQVGLPLREKNKAGDEPLGLAATRDVDRFLRSRMHFRETRFGHGNAFEEMMQDERQVSEVTWYTVPLPGMAGHLGGLHSFLVVAVSNTSETDQGAKSYVLEKAGSFGREAHQKNGVFIGSQDLSSNLKSVVGLKTNKMQLTLSEGSLRRGLKMKELHEVAHGTGPYDLASSNCHHAAQEVFNHCCAREEDRERQLPNEWLAYLGSLFQLRGVFNSTSSGSKGSGSDVASANSEVACDSSGQPVDGPSCFKAPVDLCCDAFAEVAAALSHAVYEEDPAMVLRPAEAGTVSIRNNLSRPVRVCNHGTKTSNRVEVNEVLNIAGVTEKFHVDVYAVAWAPGLYPWRKMAERQAVWAGHRYNMSEDFRGEVVLQEVVSVAPKQPVDVLHVTQQSGSNSPVQWLLARSDNALYVAFRGTDDVQDVAIDVAAVPDYKHFKEHGIGVHSGIANALEQDGDGICNVVNDVLQALQEHLQQGDRLVLCGHSLGGGYAQAMAVHLLSRNLDVAAVRTFGAPHVLVPWRAQESSNLWQKLTSITYDALGARLGPRPQASPLHELADRCRAEAEDTGQSRVQAWSVPEVHPRLPEELQREGKALGALRCGR